MQAAADQTAAPQPALLAPQPALLAPQGVAFVPTEQVLLLAVPLVGMSAAQRRAAVGFAVEGMIAQPLEEVRVVLGPALPQAAHWLVAVVSADAFAAPTSRTKLRLLPDVLALPVPAAGQWSVWEGNARILVRTADGAGFATNPSALPYFHLAAGRPEILLFGGNLDAAFAPHDRAFLSPGIDPALRQFDLAAAPGTGIGAWRKWQPIAAVAACAAIAHMALLATDVWALQRMNTDVQGNLRGALAQLGQPADGDLDATISNILAQANGGATPQFTTLTAQIFATIAAEQGRVTTAELRFAGDVQSLTLQLEAPDIATLQSVENSLKSAGYVVSAGPVTTGDGLAQQEMTVAEGGA